MAEPLLISVAKADFDSLWRLSQKGETWATDQINSLFDGFKDQPIACFLCDKPTGFPVPAMQILPEHGDAHRLIATALCVECGQLPKMVKLNRAIGILREMFRRRGKQYHVDFSPKRHHPR